MDLAEAMRTQHACRYYRDDPVPDEVLGQAVELARFAPNGGNRCAVRFVFVRDPALRRRLGEWYLPLWREVSAAARAGAGAARSRAPTGYPGRCTPASPTRSGPCPTPTISPSGSGSTR